MLFSSFFSIGYDNLTRSHVLSCFPMQFPMFYFPERPADTPIAVSDQSRHRTMFRAAPSVNGVR